jgi:chitinase
MVVRFSCPTLDAPNQGVCSRVVLHLARYVNPCTKHPSSGDIDSRQCTKNSGTLSYKEIDQIIKQDNLTPYYDKENAVKYITWNKDQWVSYDDEETFQQKIKFANNLGLGGLLIWAIDLDTDNLDALRAVLYPGKLNAFNSDANDVSYWEDAVAGDCRVTECGGKCKAGEIPITTQPCGDATAVLRRSSEDDSTLCCPVSAAPDPKKCRWDGGATGAPLCNGQCNPGEVALQSNKWGDGKYCEDGQYSTCSLPSCMIVEHH